MSWLILESKQYNLSIPLTPPRGEEQQSMKNKHTPGTEGRRRKLIRC